jgi:hypothetical protein
MLGSLTVPTIYVRNLRKRRSAAITENEAHDPGLALVWGALAVTAPFRAAGRQVPAAG